MLFHNRERAAAFPFRFSTLSIFFNYPIFTQVQSISNCLVDENLFFKMMSDLKARGCYLDNDPSQIMSVNLAKAHQMRDIYWG